LTSAFCPTTSTPRMFLTVFDDLLTASLMASSNPLLEVPTSSIIFPTGILVACVLVGSDYFTLSDETTEILAFKKNVPVLLWVQQFRYRRLLSCSTSRNALFVGSLLGGHEANLGRGSSRGSDTGRLGVGAVLRNKVRP